VGEFASVKKSRFRVYTSIRTQVLNNGPKLLNLGIIMTEWNPTMAAVSASLWHLGLPRREPRHRQIESALNFQNILVRM
jgi:hypothetical protein